MFLQFDYPAQILLRRKMCCPYLQQEQIRVHHGLAEVALDVGHGLALDLEPVADPQPAHDLVERGLQRRERKSFS